MNELSTVLSNGDPTVNKRETFPVLRRLVFCWGESVEKNTTNKSPGHKCYVKRHSYAREMGLG